MTIKLYSWPRSSGTPVAWALEELGVAYEYVQLDAAKREHRTADYLAINPHGKVPALLDGDHKFFESGAILLYLGDKYGIDQDLWPSGTAQPRADALSWTVWSMTEFGPYMMQTMYHGMDTPFSYKPQDRSRAAAEYSLAQFNRCLDAIEARLEMRQHLLGNFTLADIAAASRLMIGTAFGIKLDTHPRVATWFKLCAARPALQRAR